MRHVPVKQAAALVADVLGLPRKALYDDALRLRQASADDEGGEGDQAG